MRRFTNFFIAAVAILLAWADYAGGEIIVNPIGVGVAVPVGEETEETMTLFNNGNDAVEWRIMVRGMSEGGRDESGGPDDAGYIWRDDDEADGPVYNWIDISEWGGTVDLSPLRDDSLAGDQGYDLGFEFPYWGSNYDSVFIYPNGHVSFLNGNITFFYHWEPLPTANGNPSPSPTVMCLAYQDLNPAVAGHIYYWTDGSMAVVTWQDVPHFFDPEPDDPLWTFQLVLFANGFIKFQYQDIGMYQAQVNQTIMVGLQNEARDHGFTMVDDDVEYLEEERCIGVGPEGSWINWVTFEPAIDELGAGEEAEVTAIFTAQDMEAGVYTAEAVVSWDGDNQGSVVVPLVMSVDDAVGSIAGTITDAAFNSPVAGARIGLTPYRFVRFSDDEGGFAITGLPPGEYYLSCEADSFRKFDSDVIQVQGGQESDGSMALLHAECTPDPDEIHAVLDSAQSEDFNIQVTNGGNTDLNYTVEKRLPGGAASDPWTLRNSLYVGEAVRDSRIQGVAFAGDYFYVAGGDLEDEQNDSVNYIYILDRDGQLTDQFTQPCSTRYGLYDLDWDGDLLWGSGSQIVYGFTTEGNVTASWNGPNRVNNAIAWDSDRELLWICGITSNEIVAYDRDGQRVQEISQFDFRVRGLAYWPDDPDGFPLYVFHSPDLAAQVVHKINIDNEDTLFVATLAPDSGGSPCGAFITKGYDVYSWVFLSAVDDVSRDRVDIWQLAGNSAWMQIQPDSGQIEGGEAEDFTLTLNSEEMPLGDYEGELVWVHDGRGGEASVSIEMEVVSVQIPPDFNLLEPANGDTIRTAEVTFVWEQWVVNALYTLYLQAGDDSVAFVGDTTTLTLGLDNLGLDLNRELDNEITWWVIAESGAFTAECRERFHFIVVALVPSPREPTPPVLISPAGGDTLELVRVMFEWGDTVVVQQPTPIYNVWVSAAGDSFVVTPVDTFLVTEEDTLFNFKIWVDSLWLQIPIDSVVTWWVEAIWGEDTLYSAQRFTFIFRWPESVGTEPPQPVTFGLSAAYPNPFNARAVVNYQLPVVGLVALNLYNLNGQLIQRLVNEAQAAGEHRAVIDGTGLPAGVYLLRLTSGGETAVAKVALVK